MWRGEVCCHSNATWWIILILTHLIPSRDYSCSHIINSRGRNRAIRNSSSKTRSPKVRIRHCHIKTCQSGSNASMLGSPVRNHETLESKLCFQDSVQQLTVCTAVRVVDSLVRAHNIPRTSMEGILEWPQIELV